MPRHSRRVAARQAALSKKKRPRTGLRPPMAPPPASPLLPAATEPSASVAAAKPAAAAAEGQREAVLPPPVRSPSRQRMPAPASTTSGPSRRAVAPLPYLKSDLLTIGSITLGLLVILIVLAIFLR